MSFSLKKKSGYALLAFLLATSPLLPTSEAQAARDREPISCKRDYGYYNPKPASIVIDAKNGDILSGEYIDEKRPPASMTKIMTALLIFDALKEGRLSLGKKLKYKNTGSKLVNRNSYGTSLKNGASLTTEQALKAIIIASANNISVFMAQYLAGSETEFVKKMNEKAASLGMENTIFTNSTGLPDKAQYSTARDMAKLALHIQKEYPEYYNFFSEPNVTFGKWTKYNHNSLAVKHDYIDGIKTGYICAAGYNITASAHKDGERVINVTFGGRTPFKRDKKAKDMMDVALQKIQSRKLAHEENKTESLPNIHDKPNTSVARSKPEAPTPQG